MNWRIKLLALLALHLGLAAVVAQPVITNQPQNQTNLAGTTTTFTVGATGVQPLSYQWRSYSNTTFTNIPFGTEAMLVLTNVQPSPRRFAVVVTDAGGWSVTSSPLASLTVLAITTQPTNFPVLSIGASVSIRVAATGPAPLYYQWRLNGTNLLDKTNTSLLITNLQLSNSGEYSAVVTGSVGSLTSMVATLVVDPTFTKITTGAMVHDGGYGFACAWGDYDNDGWIDLLVANIGGDNLLYHNNGNGTFTRITQGAIVTNTGGGIGATWGDYNNDGLLDLFVANGQSGPNTLYKNEGNGSFSKITTGLLVTQSQQSHAGAWADVNNDGWLDLFVVNYDSGFTNYLYRNTGNGTFDRIAFGTKSSTNGASWNVAATDFNNDGWIDVFIPQGGSFAGRQNSLIYTNNKDGTFTLLTNSVVFTNQANSVACAWGDYDNDGFLDLFVSNFYGQNNFLYHNNGDGTFTTVTNSPVTLDGGWSVGCAWGDYDNDGWLDLFVANLGPIDPITRASIAPENNFLYHNNGDGTFTKITGGSLVNDLGYSTGCAWADYDNDGFLDLFVANGWNDFRENDFLYRNNGNSNNWITLKLIGTVSNRSAMGAKVRVKATIGGRTFWQMREISGGSNFGSQNDLRPSFGLGDATNIDLIRIEWPSGAVQTMTNVTTKQFLTVTESPRLSASDSRPDGSFGFEFTGLVGQQYRIESSSDLTGWALWQTLTATNRTTHLLDPTPQAPQRFYRAESVR